MGIADIQLLKTKAEIIEESHKRVEQILNSSVGMITDDERYNAVTAEWRARPVKLEKLLIDNQDRKGNRYDDGFWASGNISNFSRLAGMRGLMAAPNGRT